MAYLVFHVNGRELGRRKLEGPLVIGRSPECDVCVHDILLSRQHCQVERAGAGWAIMDLASKNGTFLHAGGQVNRHVLADAQQIRIGKTLVTFRAGKFVPAPKVVRSPGAPAKRQRPADPWAALADTVSGFDYAQSLEEESKPSRWSGKRTASQKELPPVGTVARFPRPQPAPRDPRAYAKEDVYSMINELASSSWDSIYLTNSRPLANRPAPRPIITTPARHSRRPGRAYTDLSLQVTPGVLTPTKPARTRSSSRRSRLKKTVARMIRGMAIVGQAVMILGAIQLLARL